MRNKQKRQLNQEARKEGIHRLTTKQKKRILLWRRNRDTQPQWKQMQRYQRRATTPRHPTGKKCGSRSEGARTRQGLRREDDSSSDLSFHEEEEELGTRKRMINQEVKRTRTMGS